MHDADKIGHYAYTKVHVGFIGLLTGWQIPAYSICIKQNSQTTEKGDGCRRMLQMVLRDVPTRTRSAREAEPLCAEHKHDFFMFQFTTKL